MAQVHCGVCGKPVADQAYVCAHCAGITPCNDGKCKLPHLAVDLGDVPALAESLHEAVIRQTKYGTRNGARSTEQPVPYDPRAADVGYLLHNTLGSWARVIGAERGVPGPQPAPERPARRPANVQTLPHPRGAHNAAQRCEVTELLPDQCHHCRRTP